MQKISAPLTPSTQIHRLSAKVSFNNDSIGFFVCSGLRSSLLVVAIYPYSCVDLFRKK